MSYTGFSPLELAYLQDTRPRLGRLATADEEGRPHVTPVGMWHYNPETKTIDITGHGFDTTRKYRNVTVNPQAAFVVDEVVSTDPWHPRAVVVQGSARALPPDDETLEALIRITPESVISWGLKSSAGGRAVSDTDPSGARYLPFDELVWHPVDPSNPDSPQMAALWGDPEQGPFGALLNVPPGFESPMHSHTHHERVLQLQGRSVHWTRGESKETAPVMTPGDYMMMPGGVDHISAADGNEDSIELITMEGAFDITVAGSISDVR